MPELAVSASCQRMEKVYAPTAGKVLKLYPMGNRIRFRTDSGLELLLNICKRKEELHSTYYHCNVLQNEIVRKGKLLMEFGSGGPGKRRRGYGGDSGDVSDPGPGTDRRYLERLYPGGRGTSVDTA